MQLLSFFIRCSPPAVGHETLLLGTHFFGRRSRRSAAGPSKARGPLGGANQLCGPIGGSTSGPLQEQLQLLILVDQRGGCSSGCCSCSCGGQRGSSIVGSSPGLPPTVAAASGQRGITRIDAATAVYGGPASTPPQSWSSSSPSRNTAGRIAILDGGGRFVAAGYLCAGRHLPQAHGVCVAGGAQLRLRQSGSGGPTSGPQQLQSSGRFTFVLPLKYPVNVYCFYLGDTIAPAAGSHPDTHPVQPVWTAQSCPGSRQQTRGALRAHQHMVWG